MPEHDGAKNILGTCTIVGLVDDLEEFIEVKTVITVCSASSKLLVEEDTSVICQSWYIIFIGKFMKPDKKAKEA